MASARLKVLTESRWKVASSEVSTEHHHTRWSIFTSTVTFSSAFRYKQQRQTNIWDFLFFRRKSTLHQSVLRDAKFSQHRRLLYFLVIYSSLNNGHGDENTAQNGLMEGEALGWERDKTRSQNCLYTTTTTAGRWRTDDAFTKKGKGHRPTAVILIPRIISLDQTLSSFVTLLFFLIILSF
jgi:hypothetical protein